MIREAEEDDIDALVVLGAMMHDESPHYRNIPYKTADVECFVRQCMRDDRKIVLVNDVMGGINGMLIGMIVPYMLNFSDGYASDLVFYVRPEGRGSKAGFVLLDEFQNWARRYVNKIKLGESAGIMPEKYKEFLCKMGYTQSGTVYSKEI